MESRVPWISEQTQGHLCKRAASMFFPFPSWWKKTPLTVETCPDPIGNSWHFRDLHTSDNKFSSLIRIGNGVWECWKVRHFYHRNKVKIARHRQPGSLATPGAMLRGWMGAGEVPRLCLQQGWGLGKGLSIYTPWAPHPVLFYSSRFSQ